jgi:hypothetical protein
MQNSELEQVLSQITSIIDLQATQINDLYTQIQALEANQKLYQEARDRILSALVTIGGVDSGLVDSDRLTQVGDVLSAQASTRAVGP